VNCCIAEVTGCSSGRARVMRPVASCCSGRHLLVKWWRGDGCVMFELLRKSVAGSSSPVYFHTTAASPAEAPCK
jgi:hypothetical protein